MGPAGAEGDGVALLVARKLGIGSQYGAGMAGEFYLGDDLDVELLCVADNVGNLGFGVKAAIGGLFAGAGGFFLPPGNSGPVDTPGTDVVELGVFLYFYSPALVVVEKPVKLVELVRGHEVEMAFDLLDGDEVPAGIEEAAPPGKARIVKDGAFGEGDMVVGLLMDVGW